MHKIRSLFFSAAGNLCFTSGRPGGTVGHKLIRALSVTVGELTRNAKPTTAGRINRMSAQGASQASLTYPPDSVFLPVPAREPFGERAFFAEACQVAVDGVVIALDDLVEIASGDAGFNLIAIQTKITLYIEAVCATGDRALGIDRAGASVGVEQWAGDWR